MLLSAPASQASAQKLPERLTDTEFWRLISDISEPGGYFRITDNFTSNEMEVGQVAGTLHNRGMTGGAYIGVGPEQNFTYIAASRPAVAFIIDIRRQAVMQHLYFKALFEFSRDRGEFISLLFSRPRPPGIDSATSIKDMWALFTPVSTDSALAQRTRTRVFDHLVKTHKFAITDQEGLMLNWVIEAFTMHGPAITTTAGQGGRGGSRGNFMTLTGSSTDSTGVVRSFLSTEDNYRFVKNLQERNLVIPVSGDFAGPKALRGIGAWLTKAGVNVNAYYLSNVEQYLFQDNKQSAFYANVATLPTTASSVFIRPYSLRGRNFSESVASQPRPLCPIKSFLRTFELGRVVSNADALHCVQ
jgi:hypothetical protein